METLTFVRGMNVRQVEITSHEQFMDALIRMNNDGFSLSDVQPLVLPSTEAVTMNGRFPA